MSKELINLDTFNVEFGKVLAKSEMFQESTKHGRKCINELKDRLIEHVSVILQFITILHISFLILVIF